MIYLKTDEEIELVRAANMVVARTLGEVAKYIAPGVTTLKLNQVAEDYIRSQGAVPGFLGYAGYPYTLCVSVNEMWCMRFRRTMRCARATLCRLTAAR